MKYQQSWVKYVTCAYQKQVSGKPLFLENIYDPFC